MIYSLLASFLRQPPRAELGRHGPGWASKDRHAGWLGGSWLAGWLSCVLWVVCCDCVCACACARVCCVLCVAGKQGHEEGGLSNRAKCSARGEGNYDLLERGGDACVPPEREVSKGYISVAWCGCVCRRSRGGAVPENRVPSPSVCP